jgi:hypothetical protein
LRPQTAAFRQKVSAFLIDYEDVLPLSSIEALEREIASGYLPNICAGVEQMASDFNEYCGPAPAGWPGSEDETASLLVDDSKIRAIEERLIELEDRQQKIDEDVRKESEREQAEARHKAEEQRQELEAQQKDAQVLTEAEEQSGTINDYAKYLARTRIERKRARAEIKMWVERKMSGVKDNKTLDNAMRRFDDERQKNRAAKP